MLNDILAILMIKLTGKLLKQVLEDENYHVEKMYSSEVWYRDVKKGKGAIATDDQILQVTG